MDVDECAMCRIARIGLVICIAGLLVFLGFELSPTIHLLRQRGVYRPACKNQLRKFNSASGSYGYEQFEADICPRNVAGPLGLGGNRTRCWLYPLGAGHLWHLGGGAVVVAGGRSGVAVEYEVDGSDVDGTGAGTGSGIC